MNGPTIPPSTHLKFVPQVRQRRCIICHRGPKSEVACERCGLPMHGDCHWERIATEEDRDRILTVPMDMPGVTAPLFMCQGCRS
jgi:hypothetical protein